MKILLIICIAVAGINFNWSFDVPNSGYNCAKSVISNHQIADNGFNPNRKKKC